MGSESIAHEAGHCLTRLPRGVLSYLASFVSDEDMIFKALSLNRLYDFDFYN